MTASNVSPVVWSVCGAMTSKSPMPFLPFQRERDGDESAQCLSRKNLLAEPRVSE